jgi:hypothetical protein
MNVNKMAIEINGHLMKWLANGAQIDEISN